MDMSRLKRHVGVLNNTGSRCIVVFRTLPDDDKTCLIVESDRVPDMYHDGLMEFCNSKEARETNDFYEILNRKTFSDGLNALQALHYKGYLRKIPISLVTLYPFPGKELPLELLNAQIDGKLDEYSASEAKKANALQAQANIDNPLQSGEPEGIAKGLLMQAELLTEEARRKTVEAYEIMPSLKPKVKSKTSTKSKTPSSETKKRGRPALSATEKAERTELRKEKRRERDRLNAKKSREAKKDATLNDAVAQKILRDAANL